MAVSETHTWASFALSTVRLFTGREAIYAASRPMYRLLITKKKARIRVAPVASTTAVVTIISPAPMGMNRSSAFFSMKYRNPPM